ncbi:Y4yA family PLP-dependent enzyme [Nocardia jejuensis]|uniref:Y4yA family PLP-dependent enzyme n=1 Tax=Nocardia jejuensis TaxID=328049 RepID=UPI001FE12C60|nr:Y4yA family PLP-dependent enzyme [Nocardia jejuensis]
MDALATMTATANAPAGPGPHGTLANRPATAANPPASIADITAAPMTAHRAEWENRLFADREMLAHIADTVGGPFHVLYPARIAANIGAFRQVFDSHGVDGTIYYGKKANKAACAVRACADSGAGVDVASIGEFTAALTGGIRGDDIVVTGPAKSEDLLLLAASRGALIAVDALDELARVIELDIAARILLRVLPERSGSRFGLNPADLATALDRIPRDRIRLEGFSFHLSGYDYAPRADLASQLIGNCAEAQRSGHPATTISLGGGFGVDYVSAQDWARFAANVTPDWFHGNSLRRYEFPREANEAFYPYHFADPGAAMLDRILGHRGLAERVRAAELRVAIEPGRALLAGAGNTVFTVQGVKTLTHHGYPYLVLTANGTSLSLSEQWFDSEYLPDPVLWPERAGTRTPTCVGGATCLESDMLSRRRIPLPRAAEYGDLLIYPNTAGYQMDSNESRFHDLPIPPKVVLHDAPDGVGFTWALDSAAL